MSPDRFEKNPYDELELIREAAQVLATRSSDQSDALLHAAETFWSVIHRGDGDSTEWSEPLRSRVAGLAGDLADGGDLAAFVHDMDQATVAGLSRRIQDLQVKFEASWEREAC